MTLAPRDVADALLDRRPDYLEAIGLEARRRVQLVDVRGAMALLSLGEAATRRFLEPLPVVVLGERSTRWRLADIEDAISQRLNA